MILLVVTALAVTCAIAVTGNGFLDLSNTVRIIFVIAVVISAILAWMFYKKSR